MAASSNPANGPNVLATDLRPVLAIDADMTLFKEHLFNYPILASYADILADRIQIAAEINDNITAEARRKQLKELFFQGPDKLATVLNSAQQQGCDIVIASYSDAGPPIAQQAMIAADPSILHNQAVNHLQQQINPSDPEKSKPRQLNGSDFLHKIFSAAYPTVPHMAVGFFPVNDQGDPDPLNPIHGKTQQINAFLKHRYPGKDINAIHDMLLKLDLITLIDDSPINIQVFNEAMEQAKGKALDPGEGGILVNTMVPDATDHLDSAATWANTAGITVAKVHMSVAQPLDRVQENKHLQKILPPLLDELNNKLENLKSKAQKKNLTDARTWKKINSLEMIIDGIRHASNQPENRLAAIRAYLELAHSTLDADRKHTRMKSAKKIYKNYTVDLIQKHIEAIDAVLPLSNRLNAAHSNLPDYYTTHLRAIGEKPRDQVQTSDMTLEEKIARLTTPKKGFFREAYRAVKANVVSAVGDSSRKQAIKQGLEAVGEFTNELKHHYDQFSEYNAQFTEVAVRNMFKLNNGKEFGKMMEYFLGKGDAGKEFASKLIERYIHSTNTTRKNDILDRCLMIAAKIGDKELFENVHNAGGEMIRNKKLVVDENNFNVLHYACQGDNAELVKAIAEAMRKAAAKGKFTPHESSISPATNQFDPFRIADYPSMLHRNTLRPIHFLSQTMAYQLDTFYKLSRDGSEGTFTAAYNGFRIENRNTARGFFDWLSLKTTSFGEVVQDTALKAKVGAAIGVAKASDEIQAQMGSSLKATISTNVASGMIIAGAAMVATGFVIKDNKERKQKAREAMASSEFVRLPDIETRRIPRAKCENLLVALKVNNIAEIKSFITKPNKGFDKTTLELIKAVKKNEFADAALKKSIYNALIAKIDYHAILGDSPKKIINTIFDSLYRRETTADCKIALKLLTRANALATPEIKTELTKWHNKFQAQQARTQQARIIDPSLSEPAQTTPPGNHELIEALENYDFYKIRHIITHGEFNYTSKKVIHALQELYTFPVNLKAKSDLHSDVQDQTFLQLLYEGLAKKAGPKQFMDLFNNLISRGQAETAKQIIGNLIPLYSENRQAATKNADCERLKMIALQAAGLGDLKSLKQVLSVLRNDPHNLSTLKIMDHQGNNILHYAAQSQHAEIIEYISPIMAHDFDVVSGKIAADKRGFFDEGMLHDFAEWSKHKLSSEEGQKKREGTYHQGTGEIEYLKNAQKIDTIFKIPNRNGLTPFKLLKNKETVARLDRFFGTAGFRMDANEHRQMLRANAENSAINRAQGTLLATMLIASCAALIPGAIAYGGIVGTAIAAKIGAGSSIAALLGGASGDALAAAGLALTTEHSLMPAFDKLGRYIHQQWGKAFNGISMESLRDFDNRILSKSDQLISILANAVAQPIPRDSTTQHVIAQTIQSFIEAESDPTMKSIAGLAAINAAERFNKMQLPDKEFDPAKDSVETAYEMLGLTTGNPDTLKAELVQLGISEDDQLDPDQLKSMLKKSIDHRRVMQIINSAAEAESNLSLSQTAKSFAEEVDRYKGKIKGLETDRVVWNRHQKINKKIDKLIDYLDRMKEKYATTRDINDIAKQYPLIDRNEVFKRAAEKKALEDFERQVDVITLKFPPNEQLNELDKLKTEHDKKRDFIQQIVNESKGALSKRKENYQLAYRSSNDISKAQNEFRAVLAKVEGGTLMKGPLTQTADKIFENMSQFSSKEALEQALRQAYKNVLHPEPAKAIRLQRAIEVFVDRMNFIKGLSPVEHLSIKSSTSSNNRLDRNIKPTPTPLDASTQIHAGRIAADYIVALLDRYYCDKSARQVLSDLGVTQVSREHGTVSIKEEYLRILANAGHNYNPTFQYKEGIILPPSFNQVNTSNGKLLLNKGDLTPISNSAVYQNKNTGSVVEMYQNSKGSLDLVISSVAPPPTATPKKAVLSVSSAQASDRILADTHEALRLHIAAKGTSDVQTIDGSDLRYIKAAILVYKANNLEYKIANDLVPKIEKEEKLPDGNKVKVEVMPSSLDELKKLCKKQKMSAENAEIAIAVFKAHCMKPEDARAQCKANGLPPLLTTIQVNDATKKAIASNKQLQTITTALESGTRLDRNTLAGFGQAIQAIAAPRPPVSAADQTNTNSSALRARH